MFVIDFYLCLYLNRGTKMHKTNDSKTKRHKKRVSFPVIAEITGSSVETVKSVLNGRRSKDTDAGQKIVLADMYMENGTNQLIEEVKRIVTFPA